MAPELQERLGNVLRDAQGGMVGVCAGAAVGFDDPSGSLPAQDNPKFDDFELILVVRHSKNSPVQTGTAQPGSQEGLNNLLLQERMGMWSEWKSSWNPARTQL